MARTCKGRPRGSRPATGARGFVARRAGRDTPETSFRCVHCKMMVGPTLSGGRHRNHCPYCLYSRHVDEKTTGDRASACGSAMAPVGAFTRPKGEHVIVHRCGGCGFERFNRIAADDDFDAVLALPVVPPRSASRGADDGQ